MNDINQLDYDKQKRQKCDRDEKSMIEQIFRGRH